MKKNNLSPVYFIILLFIYTNICFSQAKFIEKTWEDEAIYSDIENLSFTSLDLPHGMVWTKVEIIQENNSCTNGDIEIKVCNEILDSRGIVSNYDSCSFTVNDDYNRCDINIQGHISNKLDVSCIDGFDYKPAWMKLTVKVYYDTTETGYGKVWYDETAGISDLENLTFEGWRDIDEKTQEWKTITVSITDESCANGDIYINFNNHPIKHTGNISNGIVLQMDSINMSENVSVGGHISLENILCSPAKARVKVRITYGQRTENTAFMVWGDEIAGLSNFDNNLLLPDYIDDTTIEWNKAKIKVFSNCANGDIYLDTKKRMVIKAKDSCAEDVNWNFMHQGISDGEYTYYENNILGDEILNISGHISNDIACIRHIRDGAIGTVAVWAEYGPKKEKLKGNVLFAHGLTDVFNSFTDFAGYAEYRGYNVFGTSVDDCGYLQNRAEELSTYINYISDSLSIPDTSIVTIGHSMGGLDLRYIISKSGEAGNEEMLNAAKKIKSVYTIATPHKGQEVAELCTWFSNLQGYLSCNDFMNAFGGNIDLEDECNALTNLSITYMNIFNELYPYDNFIVNNILIPFKAYAFQNGDQGNDCVVPTDKQIWDGAPYDSKIWNGRHCITAQCNLPPNNSAVIELLQVKLLEEILSTKISAKIIVDVHLNKSKNNPVIIKYLNNGSIQINLEELNTIDENTTINLYDLSCKLILKTKITGQSYTINPRRLNLNTGIYFVQIQNQQYSETKKIIVL